MKLGHPWILVSVVGPGTNPPTQPLVETKGQLNNYKVLRIWLLLIQWCLPFLTHPHFAYYHGPQLSYNESPFFSVSVQDFQAELPPSLSPSECTCGFSLPNHRLFTTAIIS